MGRVLLIRHGETDWNRDGRWQGWADRPLTREGVTQARARAAALAADGLGGVEVHSSDLRRASHTARIISHALDVSFATHADLRERSGGEFEGLNIDEIEQRHPGALDAWHRNELEAPPGGESDDAVHSRVVARTAALVEAAHDDLAILLVTHGGVIRILTERGGGDGDGTPNLGGRWFTWDGRHLLAGASLTSLDSD